MENKVYNQKGEEAGKIKLSKEVFGLPWNDNLMHQIIVSMQANKRNSVAHAKDRSEVRGGGKKPWRQKGLGRARHGSIRSPIWIGGGVTHGPNKEKNYTKKINKKMRQKALRIVLSQKLRDNEIMFIDKIDLSNPKTKEANEVVKSISKVKNFEKLTTKRKNKAVLTFPKKDEKINKSFKNIPGIYITETKDINILNILNHKYLIILNPKESLAGWK